MAGEPTNSLAEDIRGLDRLELPMVSPPSRLERSWRTAWPKLLAAALAVALWQVVYWTGWKPP
ncbi:MAG TPA: ABC transporter permease, partial [Acidimicrobiia bacterium]|nr:ABC transporter permease [Acidimicrobiia bacterium]